MDIMELGAIGELVGGVAVIASLIFVGIQVRQNTKQVRSQSDTAMMMMMLEGFNPVFQNPEAFFRGMEGETDLTDQERQLFALFASRLLPCFQDFLSKDRAGTLNPEWAAFFRAYLAPFLAAPGVQAHWAETKDMYGQSFQATIEDLLVAARSSGGPRHHGLPAEEA